MEIAQCLCGRSDVAIRSANYPHRIGYYVECLNCHCAGKRRLTERWAASQWNQLVQRKNKEKGANRLGYT